MKRKVIAKLLLLSMLLSCAVRNEEKTMATQQTDTKQEYIVQTKSKEKYKKLKNNWRDTQLVINHQKEDEEYLEQVNSTIVKMSPEEADLYDEQKDVIVEENYSLHASGVVEAVEPPEEELCKEEYTNDPTKFVPAKKVNKKNSTEIVPWNIACVAGNPEKNKHRGKKVKVAIIDSGIDTHDELNTKAWVDFSDKVQGYKPTDNSGHGTAMAGGNRSSHKWYWNAGNCQ